MTQMRLVSLVFVMTSAAIASTAMADEFCEPTRPSEIDAQWKHYSSLSGARPTEGGYELYECISIESTLQIVCRTKPNNPAHPSIVIRTIESTAVGSNVRLEADTASNCAAFIKMMDQFKELDRHTFHSKSN